MQSFRVNLLIAVLLLIFIFLQYRFWFEPMGIKDMWNFKKLIGTQKNENEELKKKNENILNQIKRMQDSHDAVEEQARNHLGMIKKDEIFYEVVK